METAGIMNGDQEAGVAASFASLEDDAAASSWLSWCRSHKLLKCSETEVPAGILPKGCKGTLTDVKVSSRGPDDLVYNQNKDLRDKDLSLRCPVPLLATLELQSVHLFIICILHSETEFMHESVHNFDTQYPTVARGNCVLELTMRSGPIQKSKCVFLIFALKKFSGGMGDEDDCPDKANMWQNYFIKPVESAEKVICTRKANGEAAHISSIKLFDQDLFCVGSKNVHLLLKTKDDIEKYNDGRFQVAKVVAETFFTQIMEQEQEGVNPESNGRKAMITFLQQSRFTMVCEILQPAYQHIENLSYLKSPEIRFICWTSHESIGSEDVDSLCPEPPNVALDRAKNFGVLTVDYEIIEAANAEEYMAKVRGEFEYEGRVLYFLDSKSNVIGVLKKKTAWYVILRAIREKVCQFSAPKNSFTLQEMQAKTKKRIKEIQSWIGFTDDYCKKWTELACAFVIWMATVKKHTSPHLEIRPKFPIVWKTFLESNTKFEELYSKISKSY